MISKVDSAHATKAYGKVEDYFHSFLATALDTGGQIHVPIVLHKEKDPRYPMNTNLSGFRSHSGTFALRKRHLTMSESKTRFLGCPEGSLDTIPTALTRFDLEVWTKG
jgi:hypothetical protein